MIRRSAIPVLLLSLGLSLSALPARAETTEPGPVPSVCPGKMIDETTPEVLELLAGSQSIRPLGTPFVQTFEYRTEKSQLFEIVSQNGQKVTVKVDCNSGGCITGCAVSGCNPTTIGNEPACTAVQCVNSSGFPCASQTTCSKSVSTQNAAPADEEVAQPEG